MSEASELWPMVMMIMEPYQEVIGIGFGVLVAAIILKRFIDLIQG